MNKEHSKEWLEERDHRTEKILKKAGDKKPESYWERLGFDIDIMALSFFTDVHFNFCEYMWFLGADPRLPSRDMRKFAGKAITHAAALGQTEKCRDLHKTFLTNLNQKDKDRTALSNAVRRKRLGTAEWLLKEGASPYIDKVDWNPIVLACRNGCVPALKMFKRNGIDFNKPISFWKKGSRFYQFSKKPLYPLEVALIYQQANATKALLDMGANPDIVLDGFLRKYIQDENKTLKEIIGEQNIEILRKDFATRPVSIPTVKKNIFKRLFSKEK